MLEAVEVMESPRGKLSFLSSRGDETLTWDPADTVQVETARSKYGELVKQGYTGFQLDKIEGKESPERGKPIREFNPSATRIVMIPRTAGG
jgi:hypothetical protein